MIDEAREVVATNGHSNDKPPADDGRGMMIANRTPWLELPEPWDNLKIRAWLDFPKWVADMMTAPENETKEAAEERGLEILRTVFLEHNGWKDEDCDPNDPKDVLPSPRTHEFWERISTPLGAAITQAWKDALAGNPTSRTSRRRRQMN